MPAAPRPAYRHDMSEPVPSVQVWDLTLDGRRHRVEARGSFSRHLRWYVDDELVAEAKSSSEKVRVSAADRPELGAVGVRFSGLGKPRRATLFEHEADSEVDASTRALTGLGGIDLQPAPGSAAAAHEDRVRAQPRVYAAVAVVVGVAKVVVPILVAALFARLAFTLPWPDWNLPRLPWPDLPSIPWPDVSVPGWVTWTLDRAKLVWPVVLAVVLARSEITRRRKQDELRAARTSRSDDDDA